MAYDLSVSHSIIACYFFGNARIEPHFAIWTLPPMPSDKNKLHLPHAITCSHFSYCAQRVCIDCDLRCACINVCFSCKGRPATHLHREIQAWLCGLGESYFAYSDHKISTPTNNPISPAICETKRIRLRLHWMISEHSLFALESKLLQSLLFTSTWQ